MKKRTITGFILVLILAPFIYFGGYAMVALISLFLGIGVYELLNVKKKAHLDKMPIYLYVISILFGLLMLFDIPKISEYALDYTNGTLPLFGINLLWISLFLVTLLTCSLFDKKISLNDVMYNFGSVLYLVMGLKGVLYLRSFENYEGLILLGFVLLVTCMTDIFAYIGGMTCYKILGTEKVHKLNERISPKKTIEGTIIGTIIGTLAGFIFAYFLFSKVNLPVQNAFVYLLLSFLLSLLGQIGDLILSSIKRNFGIKDYSKLLPGHGGLLDRFDSLLINCLVAALFLNLLAYIV